MFNSNHSEQLQQMNAGGAVQLRELLRVIELRELQEVLELRVLREMLELRVLQQLHNRRWRTSTQPLQIMINKLINV